MSDDRPEIELSDWPESVSRAVEDGILDVFFESGHIVTNSFIKESAEEPDSSMPPGSVKQTIEERILELANAHGAGVVLHLKIFFPDIVDDNLPLPDKFEYTVYRRGRAPTATSDFDLDVLMLESADSGLERCTAAGKLLAQEILSQL